MVTSAAPVQLGFLTILHEASGYLGGYLVTNLWGRPLEFRLSTAVQPSRVHQVLYGPTLPGYLHSEVIGRTLVEKTSTPAAVLFTDRFAALDLRTHISTPVAWVAGDEPRPESFGVLLPQSKDARPALVAHRSFPADPARIAEVLSQLAPSLDLLEPFARIREAIAEARKLGVTTRG